MKIRLLLLLGCAFLLNACGSSDEVIRLGTSPLTFHLEKGKDPTLFATYPGGTVTTAQILEQNPVQEDLVNQENSIRLETVVKKYLSDPKNIETPLDIYLPPPKKSLAEVAKTWGFALPPKMKVNFKPTAPEKDVIAQWGDHQIHAAEADAASVRLALVRTRAYRENLNRLSGIVVRRTLLTAAKADNMEIGDFVNKHISTTSSTLTPEEFTQFLDERGIKKGDVNPEQEKSLQNIAVEERKNHAVEEYVAQHLLKGEIKVHQFPPSFNVQVPEGWEAIWGVKDAPVSILFFGDLVCGPCRDGLKEVIQTANEFKGNVKVGFDFLFPPTDRESRMISEAALCVESQGVKKFRHFAEEYATHPPGAEENEIENAAKTAGVDVDTYKKCFLSRAHKALLDQHLDFATHVGVTSQPTVLVDGEPLAGAISASELNDLVLRKVHAKSSWLGGLWRRIKSAF